MTLEQRMEVFLLTVCAVAIFLFLVEIPKRSRVGQRCEDWNLPPGPWQLPIVGGMHHLLFKHPHYAFHDLAKKHGPLIHLRIGEVSHVVASSCEAAREILKTHDLAFADRPMMKVLKSVTYDGQDLSFSPYNHHWRKLRKMCAGELFSLKRVLSFRPIREHETRCFIRSIHGAAALGGRVDLSRMLYDLSNNISARAIIGYHCKDKENLLSVVREATSSAAGMDISDIFPSFTFLGAITSNHKEIRLKMDRLFDRIIQERRDRDDKKGKVVEGEEDLLDMLLKMQDDGGLTTDSVKGVIFDVIVGGTDTTSAVLEWAMSELVRNPRAINRAQSEVRSKVIDTTKPLNEDDIEGLSYLKLIIKETLRLHPPVPLLLPRECRYLCGVLGYTIPHKARVMINVWAMGRDPSYWGERALDFDPDRFLEMNRDFKGNDFQFLPFGGGRRICPGITFGMAATEIILAHLLYYFDWKLPAGGRPEELDMQERFGLTAGRKVNLLVCPVGVMPPPIG